VIDWVQRPEALAWAEKRLRVKFDPRTVTWLTSISQTGSILGVVVFSRFTTGNCEVTVVADEPRFLSRTFLYACLFYVFIQMECSRVTAFIAVENAKSLSLAQRLGFRIEGTVRKWFPTGDAHILGLIREDCKWLKDENGQPLPSGNP
jgi:RimJ/RimL family protein N-acetyltransferase